jgi:hypothetical protein
LAGFFILQIIMKAKLSDIEVKTRCIIWINSGKLQTHNYTLWEKGCTMKGEQVICYPVVGGIAQTKLGEFFDLSSDVELKQDIVIC